MSGESVTAVLAVGPGDVRVDTVPSQEMVSDGVLIRTLASGLSTGTDRWVMTGRFAWGEARFPLVPGYQRCGIVEEVGAKVRGLSVGQLVVATATLDYGPVRADLGSHVGRAISPASAVRDATGLDPITASLFITAQVGYNAASRITARSGDGVVVIGGGIIGACAALFAAHRGFRVLVVARYGPQLRALRRAGLRAVGEIEALDTIATFAPTAAIDTVQTIEAASLYLDALPVRTGEVVFSGHTPDGALTWGDMATMQKRELTAHFVSGWTDDRIDAVLQILRDGSVDLGPLLDEVTDGADGTAELIAKVADRSFHGVGAVFRWND